MEPLDLVEVFLGDLAGAFLGLKSAKAAAAFLRKTEKLLAARAPQTGLHRDGYLESEEAADLLSAWLDLHHVPYELVIGKDSHGETEIWHLVDGEMLASVNEIGKFATAEDVTAFDGNGAMIAHRYEDVRIRFEGGRFTVEG